VQPQKVISLFFEEKILNLLIIVLFFLYLLGGSGSNVLKVAQIPIVSASVCGTNSAIDICAGNTTASIDSCQGDSGGPLFNKQNGRWVQIGVVSRGDGCYGKGIYTKVSVYANWIAQTIANN
jgi:hypothetical protein